MSSQEDVEKDLLAADLGESARREGGIVTEHIKSIVTEHIDSIVADAERRAEEIRLQGDRDAEQARRKAVESASRVFERIHALERPLGELVQTLRYEMERVGRELDGSEAPATLDAEVAEVEEVMDSDGNGHNHAPIRETQTQARAPEPAEAEAEVEEPSVVADDEPPTDQSEDSDAAAAAPAEPDEQRQPTMVSQAAPEAKRGKSKRSMLSGRRGGGKGVFITSEGHCAVCQATFMAGSREVLELSDWKVNGDVGLCPDCQANDWQLPEGARLPFRRSGA